MAQSFEVEWKDGRSEGMQLGGLRTIRETWRPLAEELGLRYVSHFDRFVPVHESNIEAVVTEVRLFRATFSYRNPADVETLAVLDEMISLLDRISREDGWKASVG